MCSNRFRGFEKRRKTEETGFLIIRFLGLSLLTNPTEALATQVVVELCSGFPLAGFAFGFIFALRDKP